MEDRAITSLLADNAEASAKKLDKAVVDIYDLYDVKFKSIEDKFSIFEKYMFARTKDLENAQAVSVESANRIIESCLQVAEVRLREKVEEAQVECTSVLHEIQKRSGLFIWIVATFFFGFSVIASILLLIKFKV